MNRYAWIYIQLKLGPIDVSEKYKHRLRIEQNFVVTISYYRPFTWLYGCDKNDIKK